MEPIWPYRTSDIRIKPPRFTSMNYFANSRDSSDKKKPYSALLGHVRDHRGHQLLEGRHWHVLDLNTKPQKRKNEGMSTQVAGRSTRN